MSRVSDTETRSLRDNVNNIGDENVLRLMICDSTQLIQTLALDARVIIGDDLTIETDWINTIANGFKLMSIDDSIQKY